MNREFSKKEISFILNSKKDIIAALKAKIRIEVYLDVHFDPQGSLLTFCQILRSKIPVVRPATSDKGKIWLSNSQGIFSPA